MIGNWSYILDNSIQGQETFLSCQILRNICGYVVSLCSVRRYIYGCAILLCPVRHYICGCVVPLLFDSARLFRLCNWFDVLNGLNLPHNCKFCEDSGRSGTAQP